MKKVTIWDVFHGVQLDKLIDKAHEKMPTSFINADTKISTKFLNGEWVVTVIATREAKHHYKVLWDQNVDHDPTSAVVKVQEKIDHLQNYSDIEIVKMIDNDGLHINSQIEGSSDCDFSGTSDDYESAYALIKVYDE